MKIKKILSLLLCLCMIAGFIPFVAKKAEAATAPTDIYGNAWAESRFALWEDGRTKFDGTNRMIIWSGKYQFYGSELLSGKHPVCTPGYFSPDNAWVVDATDNLGDKYNYIKVRFDKLDQTWFLNYKDTTSNADRYTICLSDGKTYLKDSSNAVDGKLSATTDAGDATWWDIRNDKRAGDDHYYYSIGKDKSGTDPHIITNDESDGRKSLDCSLSTTSYFSIMVEMPWYTTTFHNENGSTYKQDTRQVGTFKAPASPADKTGYTFAGWTDVKGSTRVIYKTLDDIKPTSSKDYYPVYTPNSYTVRFYSDSDLLGDYVEQSFTYDAEQALKTNTFTSPTGDFKNWKDAADGSKTYENGQTVKNLTAENGAMITLYAEWNEYFYTVAFSGNYGTGSVPSKRVRYSELFTLPDGTEFTRENYKFIGWNTKADGSGNGYSAGESVNRLTTERNGHVTLYAIWEAQHVHSVGEWETVKDATCTEVGRRVRKCETCGVTLEEETVAATGHTDGAWITIREPSCVDSGEKICKCINCGEICKSERLDPLGHSEDTYSIVEREASCNGEGEKVWYCGRCNKPVRTEAVSSTGHKEGSAQVKVIPTCNVDGVNVVKCENCGIVIREEKVAALGHKPGAFITEKQASCGETGLKTQKCETCGVTIAEEIVPATGHTEGTWITTLEPTCVNPGERVCKCVNCGEVCRSERLDPVGHKPGKAATCVDDQTCLTCGEVLEKADGRSHVMSEWTTSKEAGFFTERQERRFCLACNGEEEFRYVSGTAGCHKYFPHVDGDNCGACNVLHNVNAFFRGVAKVFGFIIFGNIGTNILFPWLHKHFHHWFNPNK